MILAKSYNCIGNISQSVMETKLYDICKQNIRIILFTSNSCCFTICHTSIERRAQAVISKNIELGTLMVTLIVVLSSEVTSQKMRCYSIFFHAEVKILGKTTIFVLATDVFGHLPFFHRIFLKKKKMFFDFFKF